jgi:uncharacterized protein YndB with AHSA1/START domain
MEGTLRQVDGRYVLRIERRLAHAPERVWRALTQPGELTHWFPADVSGALEPGAALTFAFRQGAAPPSTGTVLEVRPERLLAYTWQAEELRWELHPADGGCLLVFIHTFDDGPGAASFATGWCTCLDGLQTRLDGAGSPNAGSPNAGSPSGWSAQLHDDYVERFGLDAGTVITDGEAIQVRFVRQLTGPAPLVWGLLADGGRPTGAVLDGYPPDEATDPAALGAVLGSSETVASIQGLAYTSGPAAVRWELSDGPGGARALLVVAGTTASINAGKAYEAAHAGLARLATALRRL